MILHIFNVISMIRTLIIDITLAIVALIKCWYHLVPHFNGYALGLPSLALNTSLFAFWSADRLDGLVRVAYYNRLVSSTAIVEALPECDIMPSLCFPTVTGGWVPDNTAFFTFLNWAGFGKVIRPAPAGWARKGQPPPTASTFCLSF